MRELRCATFLAARIAPDLTAFDEVIVQFDATNADCAMTRGSARAVDLIKESQDLLDIVLRAPPAIWRSFQVPRGMNSAADAASRVLSHRDAFLSEEVFAYVLSITHLLLRWTYAHVIQVILTILLVLFQKK